MLGLTQILNLKIDIGSLLFILEDSYLVINIGIYKRCDKYERYGKRYARYETHLFLRVLFKDSK